MRAIEVGGPLALALGVLWAGCSAASSDDPEIMVGDPAAMDGQNAPPAAGTVATEGPGVVNTAGAAPAAGSVAVAGTGAAGEAGAAGASGTAVMDAGTVPEAPKFSFFVTSLEAMRRLSGSQDGFGGDLGGLEGADRICQQIAEGVGAGQKTWRHVPDTGSFEIPEALITGLFEFGLSGFPAIVLTRRSADSVETDLGCVELVAATSVRVPVDVPGLTSCTAAAPQCPDGQTCDVAGMFCR
jgi:hypothetical protein